MPSTSRSRPWPVTARFARVIPWHRTKPKPCSKHWTTPTSPATAHMVGRWSHFSVGPSSSAKSGDAETCPTNASCRNPKPSPVATSDERLWVVVGPTASGKTALAVELCEAHDGEVVSADSVQVYRHFDVGSGKPSAEERARAKQ